jgi:hypothetical protein
LEVYSRHCLHLFIHYRYDDDADDVICLMQILIVFFFWWCFIDDTLLLLYWRLFWPTDAFTWWPFYILFIHSTVMPCCLLMPDDVLCWGPAVQWYMCSFCWVYCWWKWWRLRCFHTLFILCSVLEILQSGISRVLILFTFVLCSTIICCSACVLPVLLYTIQLLTYYCYRCLHLPLFYYIYILLRLLPFVRDTCATDELLMHCRCFAEYRWWRCAIRTW